MYSSDLLFRPSVGVLAAATPTQAFSYMYMHCGSESFTSANSSTPCDSATCSVIYPLGSTVRYKHLPHPRVQIRVAGMRPELQHRSMSGRHRPRQNDCHDTPPPVRRTVTVRPPDVCLHLHRKSRWLLEDVI